MPRKNSRKQWCKQCFELAERGTLVVCPRYARWICKACCVRNDPLYLQRIQMRKSWRIYRTGAAQRNLPFELDKFMFAAMWGKPCFLCGSAVKTIGIDRIDNEKGYIPGNVAPCCWRCNRAKGALSLRDFLDMCRLVTANQASQPCGRTPAPGKYSYLSAAHK